MTLDEIKAQIPNDVEIEEISNLFKVLANPTRDKILTVLQNGELNVSDICSCVNMTKSAVSHQLAILKSAKLVKARKFGKEVYYSFDDDHVTSIFKCAVEHILED